MRVSASFTTQIFYFGECGSIAVKEGFIAPLPTKEKHIGWYEAIKGLVHDLPDSKLADWQIKALPSEIKDHLFLSQQYNNFETNKNVYAVDRCAPSFTLTSTNAAHPLKAILIDSRTSENFGLTIKEYDQPGFTIPSTVEKGLPKAILIENTGARSDRELQTRDAEEPCWTLRSMGEDGHYHRANALLNARIVALDIECLARLHSVPKGFIFSGNKALDGKGIGNGCCPLKFEKIARAVFL